MVKSPAAGKKLTFQSKMENWAEGMDYCAISVPASITKALGTRSAVLVMAQVNRSKPFQVSLFPAGGGQHYIRVRAKVRKEAGLEEGDRVKVQITVVDRGAVVLPKDLISTLKACGLTEQFKSLTPGKKNYAVRKINDATRPETRAKRIQEAVKLAKKK